MPNDIAKRDQLFWLQLKINQNDKYIRQNARTGLGRISDGIISVLTEQKIKQLKRENEIAQSIIDELI